MSSTLRASIVSLAKRHLDNCRFKLTTIELIDYLPAAVDRRKIANILMDAAKRELAAYATQGEPEAGRGYQAGKIVRRWTWHAPITGREPEIKPVPITLATVIDQLRDIKELLNTIDARQQHSYASQEKLPLNQSKD